MSIHASRTTRLALAGAAAVALGLATAGSVVAAGGASPNGVSAAPKVVMAAAPQTDAGSEIQFIAVTPCRILDTRNVGGPVNNTTRTFTAVGPYAGQGGNVSGCGIPSSAVAVELNLGAIAAAGQDGWVKAWPTGTTEPLASLVNFPTTEPIANMVTVPVNGSGQFTVRTHHSAQLFGDVAGYYVKPLYATLDPSGGIYNGISSGVVSTAHPSTGIYTVTFDRNVEHCSSVSNDLIFSGTRDASSDVHVNGDDNTVEIHVTDTTGALVDTYLNVQLSC